MRGPPRGTQELNRDGGQVGRVRSRDEGGISSGDRPRERLDKTSYVSLALSFM